MDAPIKLILNIKTGFLRLTERLSKDYIYDVLESNLHVNTKDHTLVSIRQDQGKGESITTIAIMPSQVAELFSAFDLTDADDLDALYKSVKDLLSLKTNLETSPRNADKTFATWEKTLEVWNEDQVDNLRSLWKQYQSEEYDHYVPLLEEIVKNFELALAEVEDDDDNEDEALASVGSAIKFGLICNEDYEARLLEASNKSSQKSQSKRKRGPALSSEDEGSDEDAPSRPKKKRRLRKDPILEGAPKFGRYKVNQQKIRKAKYKKLLPHKEALETAAALVDRDEAVDSRPEGHIAVMYDIDLTRLKARSYEYTKFVLEYPTVVEDPEEENQYLPGVWVRRSIDDEEIDNFDWRHAEKIRKFNKERRNWVDNADHPRVNRQGWGEVKHEMDYDTDLADVGDLDKYWEDSQTLAKYGSRDNPNRARNPKKWVRETKKDSGSKAAKRSRASNDESEDDAAQRRDSRRQKRLDESAAATKVLDTVASDEEEEEEEEEAGSDGGSDEEDEGVEQTDIDRGSDEEDTEEDEPTLFVS